MGAMRWLWVVVGFGCGGAEELPPVADVLEARCATCHAEGRMAGSWALTTWERAHTLRDPIANALAAGAMPPWPAVPGDVGFVDDRSLSPEERASLERWLEQDAPPWGEEPRRLDPPPWSQLARVDATVPIAEPYAPNGVTDDTRCFALPRPDADWVTGARIVPGNRQAVHHARLLQAGPGVDLSRLESEDPTVGWDCTEHVRTGGNAFRIANWIPGYEPPALPDGTGFALAPDAPLILVVHYWLPAWDGTPDETSVELMLASGVGIEPAEYLLVRDEGWRPGEGLALEEGELEANHARGFVIDNLIGKLEVVDGSAGLRLHSAVPHMHTHATRTGLTVTQAGTRTTLLDIPRWDFDWQLEYAFVEPVVVNRDDVLNFGCSYAGTGAPVAFGTGAEDEMCSLRLLVTGH